MASLGSQVRPLQSPDTGRSLPVTQPPSGGAPSGPADANGVVKAEPAQAINNFCTVFDDEDEAGPSAAYPMIPSPPPLPDDFIMGQHNSAAFTSPAQLFNFSQFSERMPMSQPLLNGPNKLVKDLTQEALDLVEANVVYGANPVSTLNICLPTPVPYMQLNLT